MVCLFSYTGQWPAVDCRVTPVCCLSAMYHHHRLVIAPSKFTGAGDYWSTCYCVLMLYVHLWRISFVTTLHDFWRYLQLAIVTQYDVLYLV